MIKLSATNLLRNKGRTILTILGITIGVAAIVSLVSISDGINNMASRVLGSSQYILALEKGAVDDTMSHLPIDVVERVSRVRGVNAVTSQISFFINHFNGEEISATSISQNMQIIQGIGIEPENAQAFENSIYWFNISKGRMILPGEDNAVLVSTEFASDNHLFVGSAIEVNRESFRIVGMFDVGASLGSMNPGIIIMTLDKAAEFAGYSDEEVGFIQILPDDLSQFDRLIQRLKETIPEIRVMSSSQVTDMLGTFLGSLTLALWVVSSIAGVVGGIGVMNTVLMSVMERIKEFGVLKAIGWRTSHIIVMVLFEALLIGLVGGVSGVFFGFIGSFLVQLVSGIPTFISFLLIGQVLFFAGLIGVVSAIYPALVAASMSPVEAVRFE